jgi:predicted PurR-regulated permease PerM
MEPTQWQIFHFVVGIMVSLIMWWAVGLFRSWDLIDPLLIAVITGLIYGYVVGWLQRRISDWIADRFDGP